MILIAITIDFKRNPLDRTRIYEYAPPPPPPINALVTDLHDQDLKTQAEGEIFKSDKTRTESCELIDNVVFIIDLFETEKIKAKV